MNSDPDEDLISSARLTRTDKALVWAYIKTHDPELLAFITSAEVQGFRDRWTSTGGTCAPLIPRSVVEKALGRKFDDA